MDIHLLPMNCLFFIILTSHSKSQIDIDSIIYFLVIFCTSFNERFYDKRSTKKICTYIYVLRVFAR